MTAGATAWPDGVVEGVLSSDRKPIAQSTLSPVLRSAVEAAPAAPESVDFPTEKLAVRAAFTESELNIRYNVLIIHAPRPQPR